MNRHTQHARHARPEPARRYVLYLAAIVTLAVTPGLTLAVQASARQHAPGAPEAAARLAPAAAALREPVHLTTARYFLPAIAARYTVRDRDTLWGIAVTHCGAARDWTGIFEASRAVIGTDPNLIRAGQALTLRCTDPPALLRLGRTEAAAHTVSFRAPAAVRAGSYGHPYSCGDGDGDGWDVPCRMASRHGSSARAVSGSYGHPYSCGDGDGDGWDVPCRTASRPAAVRAVSGSYGHPYSCGDGDGDGWDVPCRTAIRHGSSARAVFAGSAARSSGGTYSYAGLEALWVSAGGPAWAEAHAAEIAECESGGNSRAFNPSGASGLWQILGSVVPGDLFSPYINALNAVAKFRASGDTFAQWVCK